MEATITENQKTAETEKRIYGRILLLDSYDREAKRLIGSFEQAKRRIPVVVVRPNGFLPEGILSPYGYFQGDYSADRRCKGTPLYFNEVPIPDYWQIRSDREGAVIYDRNQMRGKIRFLRNDGSRLVTEVDYLDERGRLRLTDHYNQYGARDARTIYDEKSKAVFKTYYSPKGREVLTEHYQTGVLVLNECEGGRQGTMTFPNRSDFVIYFLRKMGMDQAVIYYNSLSVPFLVSCKLRQRPCQDVLFWSEKKRPEIPGNMKMIFEGRIRTTKMVCVQNRESYDQLIAQGADPGKICRMGYVYPFVRSNYHSNHALICTASDQLEQIDLLIENLPEIQFHIVALTEMSEKLLEKGRYENVQLYPNAKDAVIESLFQRCDWYFDINHGKEILSAVERAFLNNQIIFGIEKYVHEPQYVCREHICSADSVHLMVLAVKLLLSDFRMLDGEIERQHAVALSENEDTYQSI